VNSRRWDFISAHAGAFGVQRLCLVLEVSRLGYYRWIAGTEARAARQAEEAALVEEIREIHTEHRAAYGAPRVHAELRGFGHTVNRKRVTRLMREHGIVGLHLRRRKRTTVPDPVAPPAPDLVGRDFTAADLDERWCGDITYIRVGSTWLYLACVIDICSRRVLGWSMATHMRADLVIDALEAAVGARDGDVSGVIFHSDRGSQGGFNRSSQHLVFGGVDGSASRVDAGVDGQVADEVAGGAGASTGGGTPVLAGDRQGVARRGGGSRGRRVAGCGRTLVPPRWRHAADGTRPAVRPVPVLWRA